MTPWKARAIAAALPVVILLPWLGKPMQCDDHVFVWVAQQIAEHPFDFFGFTVEYGWGTVPIRTVDHNPPLISYVMAPVGALTGWSEFGLHAVMLLFAGLAGVAVYELARDTSKHPLPVTVATVLTPAFLVSASTLMTDLPLLAAYTWAIVGWRRAFQTGERRWLWVAAIAAAAAPLTKYYGVTLFPLLALYAMLCAQRPRRWWLFLGGPVCIFAAYQAYIAIRYDANFAEAASVALDAHWRTAETSFTRPVLTLVFIGGCMAPIAAMVIPAIGARWTIAFALAVGALSIPAIEGFSVLQLFLGATEPYPWIVSLHFTLFLFAGCLLLAAVLKEFAQAPQWRDVVLFGCWIGGTLLFTVAVNHFVSVRTVLPMLPALAVLALAKCEWRKREVALLFPAAALSIMTLVADNGVAVHDRDVAREILRETNDKGVALHYVAFWGLEYYLQQGGAKPFAFAELEDRDGLPAPAMARGDRLIVDSYASDPWQTPLRGFVRVNTIEKAYFANSATFDVHGNAGFYAHRVGMLPYTLGAVPAERFLVYEWRGAN